MPQRAPEEARSLPGQAFTAFLGSLHRGWSTFTVPMFTVGDYLLHTTKDRMLLITSKRRMLQFRGGKWLNWSHSILGWFSTDFRKLKILSQHLLPQSRVRDFLGKQVSEQPRYRAGLIPHRSSCVWAWVLPARPCSRWLF